MLLNIDRETFREAFATRPLSVGHALADHELLSLEGIARLADALPLSAVERHRADLPVLHPGAAEDLGGKPSETALNIETNGCWMVLWNIERIPEYKRLLDDCLDEAAALLGDRHGGMVRREAFLFLSAPNAVTPAHFDPEHNFLLQIRGVKEMNVGRFRDAAAQQRELDRYHDGGHRNLEAVPEDAETFVMHPGGGVYVYPWAPHWVRNGPAVSTSLSITFRTRQTEQAERVMRFNARLRRLRLSPRPAGSSSTGDRVKAGLQALIER